MPAVIQLKRRIGTPGAPAALAAGEAAYTDTSPSTGVLPSELYIGTGVAIDTLVSATRQVELTGAQTIALGSPKTIDINDLKLLGGVLGQVPVTDGAGNLAWATAAGLVTVAVDTIPTLLGDGTVPAPLSVLQWRVPTPVGIIVTPGGGTDITMTPALVNGDPVTVPPGPGVPVDIVNFEVTRLDGGLY